LVAKAASDPCRKRWKAKNAQPAWKSTGYTNLTYIRELLHTHEKIEKNEKAMAAWTLFTPYPFSGLVDLPHWLAKYQKPTKYRNDQKAEKLKSPKT
jgi:hypothetical protein